MRAKNAKPITQRERDHLHAVKECSETGCGRPVIARGMCHTHYMRIRRAGALEPRVAESDADYLAARALRTGSGCLEWSGSKREGCGRLVRHGRHWQAHVFSYITHVGPLPAGSQVNHRCHNRACVDPAHLYAGSQAENVADMLNAGRANPVSGESNGNSKVSAEAVRDIRRSKEIARVEAEKHGVSISLVYAIRKRLVWRELPDA